MSISRRQVLLARVKRYFHDYNKFTLFLVTVIFVLGFFFRISNLFHPGFEFDTIQTQYAWSQSALDYGYENKIEGNWGLFEIIRKGFSFINGYGIFWNEYKDYMDYLPGALFLGMIFAYIGNLLDPLLPGGSPQAFVTVMKTFNLFIDLGIAILCYLIARRYAHSSKEKSSFILSVVFALPSLWFVSNVWGQFDSLVVLLAAISVILMYARNKHGGNLDLFRDYGFWSGIFFAIGFWLKPLIILLIPLILAYHFANKKALVIKSALLNSFFWLLMAMGAGLLAAYFNSNNNSFTILGIIFSILIGVIIYTFRISIGVEKPLTTMYRQVFGFWLGSLIIIFLPVINNPAKFVQVLSLPLTKENIVSAGASSFWSLIGTTNDASTPIISLSGIGPSIGIMGFIIFASLMILIYLRFQGIGMGNNHFHRGLELKNISFKLDEFIERLFQRKISFANFTILMTLLGSSYFLFITKMHSRYLIWSIIFSLLALAAISNKKHWTGWFVMLLVMHFGFILNQLGVFNAWYQTIPWISHVLTMINADEGRLSSLSIFLGFLGLYLWSWKYINPNSSLIQYIVH